MQAFINDNFLLSTEPAQRLYHEYAEKQPIFDYHCHLNPQEIYENKQFSDIGEAWLAGDHYKWRVMRANAVDEKYITGDASFQDKFYKFAQIMPTLIGNPIYHWSHLELKRFFDLDVILSEKTADKVWDAANQKLQSESGRARSLIAQSNVKALCTTDDPADNLKYHNLLADDKSFTVKVLPTFRPEQALSPEKSTFGSYMKKLGDAAGVDIKTIDDVKAALVNRAEYFAKCGCKLSDHSFGAPDFTIWDKKTAESALAKALKGESVSQYEISAYQSYMMDFLGEIYTKYDFTMQLHIGVLRNLNTKRFLANGADIGCDSIGDTISAASLAALLDRLAVRNALPKTILYTLNAADNDKLAVIAGCFQDSTVAGKIQFGSAWWFHDHFDGMTAQMKSLANVGVLSRFIGMLTDSRSFLSYPRHEYFRRILCELVGGWIASGKIPADYESVGKIISNICYDNVCNYINI